MLQVVRENHRDDCGCILCLMENNGYTKNLSIASVSYVLHFVDSGNKVRIFDNCIKILNSLA